MQGFLPAVMAVAPVHMSMLSVTLPNEFFQDVKSLSNVAAPLNMFAMVVTSLVSHLGVSAVRF